MKYFIFILLLMAGVLRSEATLGPALFNKQTRLLFVQTNSVTVTNTASETTLIGGSGNGIGSTNIPANFFTPGKKIHVHAAGVLSAPAAAAGNRTIAIKFGSTVMCSTGSKAVIINLANMGWTLDADVICINSGAFKASGMLTFRDPTTLGAYGWDMINFPGQTIAFDPTGAAAFDLTTTATVSSGNSMTAQILEITQSN